MRPPDCKGVWCHVRGVGKTAFRGPRSRKASAHVWVTWVRLRKLWGHLLLEGIPQDESIVVPKPEALNSLGPLFREQYPENTPGVNFGALNAILGKEGLLEKLVGWDVPPVPNSPYNGWGGGTTVPIKID